MPDPCSKSPARLFISHISEEAEVAVLLKQALESDFPGLVECFASSDISSIVAGEDWLTAVKQAMSEAVALIVLCSKASVQRPWVQFEMGAAWMRGLMIIPVCHSGMRVTDLQMPLSRLQCVELATERGLQLLYRGVANALELNPPPGPADLTGLLTRIDALEERFHTSQVQQFERYIDVLIPPPGRLESELIPDDAVVESNEVSWRIFGFIPGEQRTWQDIVQAAQRTPDQRWLGQLQRCIFLASRNEMFSPVQAIFHAEDCAYQPQLAKKEVQPDGSCRFHVHFVETVVAPLSEVPNNFGLLATLLRLGLRFRYEVVERFKSRAGGLRPGSDQVLQQLRSAIEVIENDALSRGAENIDRAAVVALFERTEEQDEIARLQDEWDDARNALFQATPPLSAQQAGDVVQGMSRINFRFMALATQRFHEMTLSSRWDRR